MGYYPSLSLKPSTSFWGRWILGFRSYLSSDSKKPMGQGSLKKSPNDLLKLPNQGTERRQCKTFELKRTNSLPTKTEVHSTSPPPTTNIKLTKLPENIRSSLCLGSSAKTRWCLVPLVDCERHARQHRVQVFLVVPRNCV